MRTVLIAAASGLCLISVAAADIAAEKGSYELRLDQKNGERTIAVSNVATGAVAVAAGGERLDLLSARDADAALKRLKVGPDLGIPLDDSSGGGDKRKIVIHKMDYDDGDEADANDDREVRILKRHQHEDDDSDGDADGDESDDLFSMELDSDDEAGDGDDGVQERRILFIKGADAKTATKFIDKIDGLEADEKAAMKEAVGL